MRTWQRLLLCLLKTQMIILLQNGSKIGDLSNCTIIQRGICSSWVSSDFSWSILISSTWKKVYMWLNVAKLGRNWQVVDTIDDRFLLWSYVWLATILSKFGMCQKRVQIGTQSTARDCLLYGYFAQPSPQSLLAHFGANRSYNYAFRFLKNWVWHAN